MVCNNIHLPFVQTFQAPVVQQMALINSAPVAMLQPSRGNTNIKYNYTVYCYYVYNKHNQ
jgi:hypothetical protein